MEEENKILSSKPASPDTQLWYNFMVEQEQKTPERIEEVAKVLSGIISVSLTIFLSVSSTQFEGGDGDIKMALGLWLVSLLFSFVVLFPFPHKYNDRSTKSFIKTHGEIKWVKYWLLVLSVVFFLAALVMLCFKVFG